MRAENSVCSPRRSARWCWEDVHSGNSSAFADRRVQVVPGDIVVGDDDGIIVGTTAEFAAVVEAAEAIQTREKALRISIENGFSLFDTLNFTEHRQRLIAGIDSKLTFEN